MKALESSLWLQVEHLHSPPLSGSQLGGLTVLGGDIKEASGHQIYSYEGVRTVGEGAPSAFVSLVASGKIVNH